MISCFASSHVYWYASNVVPLLTGDAAQVCIHPVALERPRQMPPMPDLLRASSKFSVLAHMLLKMHHCGFTILIFSAERLLLDMVEEFLQSKRADGLDISHVRLDGHLTEGSR